MSKTEVVYWQVSPGREGRGLWPEFRNNNIIGIGWDDLGDLRGYDTGDETTTKEKIMKALKKNYNLSDDSNPSNDVNSLYVFFKEIRPGHIIVAKKGYFKEIYGIGKVSTAYRFDSARKIFKHIIGVSWIIAFDERVKVDVAKAFWIPTAGSLKPARFEEIRRSILRTHPEFDEKFRLLMESTGNDTGLTQIGNWWIEKTLVKGRPDRESGPYSLGKALWSPQKDERGADIYKNMRLIKKGDRVLHLIDNKSIVGVSYVRAEYDASFLCLPGTEWNDATGKRPAYLVLLENYTPLKVPIDRDDIFQSRFQKQLSKVLDQGHDVFYNRDLNLRQGAYLTEAPSELLMTLNQIYKEKTGEEIVRLKTPSKALQLEPSLVSTKLFLPRDILSRVCAHLNCGSHVVITGPVGTGKTSVAEDVCCAAQENQFCDGYILTTASSDWTTFDTIGGYMPTEGQKLRFEEGKFLEAIRKNKWLIIDEINRADIDKAFGQLFTVLSGQNVELPFKHSNGKPISILVTNETGSNFDETAAEYRVGENWRIIATMNIYDMNFLFEMSYAFMRRFAFVYIDVPEKFGELIRNWCAEKKLSAKTADRLEKLAKLAERKMGPAIIRDIVNYLQHRGDGDRELAEAIVAYILPQLEGLEKDRIGKAWEQIGAVFEDKAVPNTVIRPILREIVGIELKEASEPEKVQ